MLETHEMEERCCSHCHQPMDSGYVIENGEAYYCSMEHLLEHMTYEEYLELHDDGEGDSYWTQWEE